MVLTIQRKGWGQEMLLSGMNWKRTQNLVSLEIKPRQNNTAAYIHSKSLTGSRSSSGGPGKEVWRIQFEYA
jgi:hypothetical protein